MSNAAGNEGEPFVTVRTMRRESGDDVRVNVQFEIGSPPPEGDKSDWITPNGKRLADCSAAELVTMRDREIAECTALVEANAAIVEKLVQASAIHSERVTAYQQRLQTIASQGT